MPVRELARDDGPAARRLWDDLGGWYRNTSPTSDGDVDRAIGRLLRRRFPGRRPRRGETAEGGWIAESRGTGVGWLYARAEAEQEYIVPLVPPEDTTGAFEALLVPAREWLRNVDARAVLVDVPDGRADLRAVVQRSGRVLWHRAVLDRDVSPLPSASAVPTMVREFHRSDLSAAQSLFGIRHPGTPLSPIPVPFLELRGGWMRDPAWEIQRTIWLAGPRRELQGVAGGTHRPGAPIGFLGPWVLAENTTPTIATELLGAVVSWLREMGAQRIRTTIPTPPGEDARMLMGAGFSSMAESDLWQINP